MNSFMFSLENFLKSVSLGSKYLKINRQNKLIKQLILCNNIERRQIKKRLTNKNNTKNSTINNQINTTNNVSRNKR